MIAAIALAIAAFLVAFLVVPVASVVYTAFASGDGGLTFSHVASFFGISLMRESFWNSLYVAGLSVVVASLIAIPLAYFTVRFRFRGAALVQTLLTELQRGEDKEVRALIVPPLLQADPIHDPVAKR
jgi:iron(III) transport system permease protein